MLAEAVVVAPNASVLSVTDFVAPTAPVLSVAGRLIAAGDSHAADSEVKEGSIFPKAHCIIEATLVASIAHAIIDIPSAITIYRVRNPKKLTLERAGGL